MPGKVGPPSEDAKTVAPPRVTIDTNCVIDLEQQSQVGAAISGLVGLDRSGLAKLCVPAIMASERRPDGKYIENFDEFLSRLRGLGLDDIEILRPIGYWGVTFWDWSLYSDPDLKALEREIHEILFPGIEFDYSEYRARRGTPNGADVLDRKWRNAKCDVLAMWCHIHYAGDLFVTNDSNYHRATKKDRLERLGARKIVRPHVAVLVLGA